MLWRPLTHHPHVIKRGANWEEFVCFLLAHTETSCANIGYPIASAVPPAPCQFKLAAPFFPLPVLDTKIYCFPHILPQQKTLLRHLIYWILQQFPPTHLLRWTGLAHNYASRINVLNAPLTASYKICRASRTKALHNLCIIWTDLKKNKVKEWGY